MFVIFFFLRIYDKASFYFKEKLRMSMENANSTNPGEYCLLQTPIVVAIQTCRM